MVEAVEIVRLECGGHWAHANELDRTLGGKSVEIAQPPFPPRRTVYAYLDRQDLPNLFRAFDLASPDSSAAKRPRTTVPQQSLFLMNSPFIAEQAQALAKRSADSEPASPAQRLERLYHFALARSPSEAETNQALAFVEGAKDQPAGQLDGWEQLAQLLMLTNEFAYVD